MHKYLPFFLILFSAIHLKAQKTECAFDEEGNCIGKGKTKTVKHKTSYGGSYETIERTGPWVLLNTDGVVKAKGEYSSSLKIGEWHFFSDEGTLLFKRWYKNGIIEKTIFTDSGYYAHAGDTITIQGDSMGHYFVFEKKGTIKTKYQTEQNQTIAGQPSQIAAKQKQPEIKSDVFEQLTDAELMQKYTGISLLTNTKLWAISNANNLINNPGFELERQRIPAGFSSQIKPEGDNYATYWGSANETPDMYFDGMNCYAGYRVIGVNYEVLRNQLKQPLKAGVKYCLQFRLRLKTENNYAANSVSVTLSSDIKQFRNTSEGIANGVVLQTHPDIPLACRQQWMTISGSFTAKGGEQYLYIGNFTPDSMLKLTSLAGRQSYVGEIYYYLDDVVLIEQQENTVCPCTSAGCDLNVLTQKEDSIPPPPPTPSDIYTSPKVGQKLVLRNVQFETNKWDLPDGTTEILDSLADLLYRYPSMKVEISGHTDNRGNAKDNQILSQNRAFAVTNYLMERGIGEDRLTFRGAGETEPIDTNDTETGRFNNRRVEFKILEM